MAIIGNPIYQVAFLTDTFNGNGSTTAFTMSVAPANTSSVLVAVSGVLQDPSTYSVSGTTLTFSGAPPTGTGNISARYLGIPASGVTTTAYRTVTEFTATANQKTFTPPSYTVGFINVYRNGVLLGSADYTATNGTTVVLATGATSGDLVTVESFLVSSVLNAIPATTNSVIDSYVNTVSASKLTGTQTIPWGTLPTGSVLQVVQGTLSSGYVGTASTTYVTSGITATITPKFSTSKILMQFSSSMYLAVGTGPAYTTFYKNSTNLSTSGVAGIGAEFFNVSNAWIPCSAVYLDSPATTSATTYSVYFRVSAGSTVLIGGDAGMINSIILTEIAG